MTSRPATSCARSASRTCRSPPACSARSLRRRGRVSAQRQRDRAACVNEEEFGNIIIKSAPDGVGDTAQGRGAHRARRGTVFTAQPAQQQGCGRDSGSAHAPGANALELASAVRASMEEIKQDLPRWRELPRSSTTPPSSCASRSLRLIETLLEAIALVVIVVVLFLQTWRASIIPLLAVPISIVGTFGLMLGVRVFDQQRCRYSGWCSPSASWWTMRSWWWRNVERNIERA